MRVLLLFETVCPIQILMMIADKESVFAKFPIFASTKGTK